MWFHYINDNEKIGGQKGWPRCGRFHWHLGEHQKCISFEWSLFRKTCHIGFDINNEDWTFKIAIPLIAAFYLSFEGFKFLDRIAPKKTCIATWDNGREFTIIDEREFRIAVHDWTVWIDPWSRQMEWNRSDPWYVRGITFHIDTFFLGKREYSSEVVQEKKPLLIPMPEGCYEGTYQIVKQMWWRCRFPFLKTVRYSADIDIPKGVPFNGKGENSWDQGTDGLFGTGVEIKRFSEAESKAIATVVESVMESRGRHGTPSADELNRWRERVIS